MNLKKTMMAVVLAGATLSFTGVASAKSVVRVKLGPQVRVAIKSPPRAKVAHRQSLQKKRILKGRKAGQITARERRALVRQQRRIQRTKVSFIKNDGRLNRGERKVLRSKQRRASRSIRAARHNRRARR